MIIEKIKEVESLPNVIEKEIKQRKKEEFYDIYLHEDNLYVVASLGKKNKAGYKIEVQEIEDNNTGRWKISIGKREPKKNQIVTQVINYPISITKVWINKNKGIPEEITFIDKSGKAITTTNIKKVTKA